MLGEPLPGRRGAAAHHPEVIQQEEWSTGSTRVGCHTIDFQDVGRNIWRCVCSALNKVLPKAMPARLQVENGRRIDRICKLHGHILIVVVLLGRKVRIRGWWK